MSKHAYDPSTKHLQAPQASQPPVIGWGLAQRPGYARQAGTPQARRTAEAVHLRGRFKR